MAFYTHPSRSAAYVVLFYRNFLAKGGGKYSHVGLGVNALHTVKVLRSHKIKADAYGVWEVKDVRDVLKSKPGITHAILEAPWVRTLEIQMLCRDFPDVHFVARNHSQVGFLQVDNGGARLLREYALLQDGEVNFNLSANSARFCQYFERVYQGHCLFLPNLYVVERPEQPLPQNSSHDHRLLRIASFGSIRVMKNHPTSAAAALTLARRRRSDLEFYVSQNREENGKGVFGMMVDMFAGLKWAKLVPVPWESWAEFRRTVSTMDLCLQMSMTETFNLVTADACAEGIPSVVGPSIEWAPKDWKADIDDPNDIASVGNFILNDPADQAKVGLAHLKSYIFNGLRLCWFRFLDGKKVSNDSLI